MESSCLSSSLLSSASFIVDEERSRGKGGPHAQGRRKLPIPGQKYDGNTREVMPLTGMYLVDNPNYDVSGGNKLSPSSKFALPLHAVICRNMYYSTSDHNYIRKGSCAENLGNSYAKLFFYLFIFDVSVIYSYM